MLASIDRPSLPIRTFRSHPECAPRMNRDKKEYNPISGIVKRPRELFWKYFRDPILCHPGNRAVVVRDPEAFSVRLDPGQLALLASGMTALYGRRFMKTRTFNRRHARTYCGHPRLPLPSSHQDVDARRMNLPLGRPRPDPRAMYDETVEVRAKRLSRRSWRNPPPSESRRGCG
jgi:hypothetical protein